MKDHQQIGEMSAEVWSERLFQRFQGKPFPLSGQWEITCRCNLRCVMCYTDPFNTPEQIRQELSYEEIVRILDEIHKEGCLEITFTGGEPFARRDFLHIYTYAKSKGFLLTIFYQWYADHPQDRGSSEDLSSLDDRDQLPRFDPAIL